MILFQKATDYNKKFGFNVIPLKGKQPYTGSWSKWQNQTQSVNDIRSFDWRNSTGIGIIQGINSLRVLDFDGVVDYEIVDSFLKELGLGDNYEWVTKTGSGKGAHIVIKVNDEKIFVDYFAGTGIVKLQPKEGNYCKHIELRWKNCYSAFPPSIHPDTSGIYTFYNQSDVPNSEPALVSADLLIKAIKTLCQVKPSPIKVTNTDIPPAPLFDKKLLQSALDFLSLNLKNGSYDEWLRIGFALSSLGKEGEEMFVEMSLKNPNYHDSEKELRKKFKGFIKDSKNSVSLGTIYYLAEQKGWKKPFVKFWTTRNKKPILNKADFKKFLEREGFCKILLSKSYLFVRIVDNIIDEINTIIVKDFVMDFINNLTEKEFGGTSKKAVINKIMNSDSQYFSEKNMLEYLPTKPVDFLKDQEDCSYIYFSNKLIKIDKDNIQPIEYGELDKCVWKKQIIANPFEYTSNKSDFETFLENTARGDRGRINSVKSAIGYMIHRYKDPSITKAVIFIDEKLSDAAYGRSGKGIVIKALAEIRNTVTMDGRTFTPAKNFAYQRIDYDTEIFAIEDLEKDFKFEKLYSCITDGFTIEKKNKDELYIPYNDSPKIALTTNYSIKGISDSSLDRQFIIEFSDFYNMNHEPKDDFGELFFTSWTYDKWMPFFSFMIHCTQFYLQHGLVKYEYANLNKKRLIDETSDEFIEFMGSEEVFQYGQEYNKKDFHTKFIEYYPDKHKLTQNTFTKWIKTFAKLKGFEYEDSKSGADRFFKINRAVPEKAGCFLNSITDEEII